MFFLCIFLFIPHKEGVGPAPRLLINGSLQSCIFSSEVEMLFKTKILGNILLKPSVSSYFPVIPWNEKDGFLLCIISLLPKASL